MLTAWAAASGVALAMLGRGWRKHRELTARQVAGWLEDRGHRRGSLTGHLDDSVAGTSSELRQLADQRSATALQNLAEQELLPYHQNFQRRAMQGGGAVLAGLTLLWSAGPTHGPAALLFKPPRGLERRHCAGSNQPFAG